MTLVSLVDDVTRAAVGTVEQQAAKFVAQIPGAELVAVTKHPSGQLESLMLTGPEDALKAASELWLRGTA